MPAFAGIGNQFGEADRLGESRQVVGRIVVDENQLITRVAQHFGQAIDADGRALVKIVAVVVVAPVGDDRQQPPSLSIVVKP